MAQVGREVRIGACLAAVFLILAFVCLVSLAALPTGASSPKDVWTEVEQTKTAGEARVTLEWAYADERFVAVLLRMGRPVKYSPSLWDDTVGNEAEFPPHVQITDASGQDFDSVGGGIFFLLTAREQKRSSTLRRASSRAPNTALGSRCP